MCSPPLEIAKTLRGIYEYKLLTSFTFIHFSFLPIHLCVLAFTIHFSELCPTYTQKDTTSIKMTTLA